MNHNIRNAALAAAVAIGAGAAAGAHAASVELQQNGSLHSGSYLDTYYTGGYAGNTYTSGPLTGVSAYGPGPNLGFSFSANAVVQSSGTSNGKFENLPTGDLDGNTQVLSFSSLGGSTTTDAINFAAGFSALSFNYSLDNNSVLAGSTSAYNQTAIVWSGLNGTGTEVGTIALGASTNPIACQSRLNSYCSWSAATANSLSGVGKSITFGVANSLPSENFELDAVTVAPAAAPVPLPASAWLLLTGLAGLGAASFRRRKHADMHGLIPV